MAIDPHDEPGGAVARVEPVAARVEESISEDEAEMAELEEALEALKQRELGGE